MSFALLRLLKSQINHLQVTALAPAFARPLVERSPDVDAVIDSPFGHGGLKINARRAFAKSLPAFDAAVVLPNSLKSALIPAFARIPKRVGWRGEARFGLLTHQRKLNPAEFPRMVDRYTALSEYFDVSTTAQLAPRLTARSDEFDWRSNRPLLVLAPGAAFGSAKRWPTSQFAQLALRALSQGFEVVLVGGPDEAEDCRSIAAAQPPAYQPFIHAKAGSLTLGDSIDLIAQADIVVANDSGLMHVAAALGVKVVGLFGPTSPEHTPPLSDLAAVIWSRPECAPCFQKTCPKTRHACMEDLSVDQVVEVLG